MNDNDNWVNLPSPIPESLWGDTYHNPRQKAFNDDARTIFATSVKNGCIKESDGQYICTLTNSLDLTDYSLDVKTDTKILHAALRKLQDMQENGFAPAHDGKRVIACTVVKEEAEAHFIRNLTLINFAKAENAKYAKLARKIAEIEELLSSTENENGQIDEFLRTLTCEAIVKRGAHYVYEKELEDDPWPAFVNLLEQADYPEYAMFENYKALPTTRQKMLKSKAKHHEETWQSDKLLINMKKWQGKMAVRKNQLDKDMWKYSDGTKIYAFYRNVLLRLNSQVEAMQG